MAKAIPERSWTGRGAGAQPRTGRGDVIACPLCRLPWPWAVGLGDDLDTAALVAMASRPDWYHAAPDAEALAGIYHQIAVTTDANAQPTTKS